MKKKKILILGASGMAGHVISIYLKDLGKYDVIDVVYRTKIDGKSIIIDISQMSRERGEL